MITKEFDEKIVGLIHEFENPQRIALSKKYPFLRGIIIFARRTLRNINNIINVKIRSRKQCHFFKCVVARHQSVLRRKLGESDPVLQENKIINLQKAIFKLDGLVIDPGNMFSFWHTIGKPSLKNGYVNGMLLSGGSVVEGIGGGLCQLSNFIYWLFLHTPIDTVERYHHSMDVFPDSGRTLPFGGGATVLYNFIDVKVKNISKRPLQLKIWLDDNHLKGKILSSEFFEEKYHIFEKNHYIIKRGDMYFRYNEIYRQLKIKGEVLKTEKISINFAPIMYKVDKRYLEDNNFNVLDYTEH